MADKFFTLHDLIANLTKTLNLTPEQQFEVTAKIKRYVHFEKRDLFSRYSLYSRGSAVIDPVEQKVVAYAEAADPFLHKIMTEKAEQHGYWAEEMTDEEIVTWDVGSHKYVQEKPPCDQCGKSLTGVLEYLSHHNPVENKRTIYCRPCAEASGEWAKFYEGEETDEEIYDGEKE